MSLKCCSDLDCCWTSGLHASTLEWFLFLATVKLSIVRSALEHRRCCYFWSATGAAISHTHREREANNDVKTRAAITRV